MNKGLCILSFSLGAAIGSLVSWRVLKAKYEQIAQDEIDSYKEYVKKKDSVNTEPTEEKKEEAPSEDDEEEEDESYFELHSLIQQYKGEREKEEVTKNVNKPYVITPEECGDQDGYGVKYLTHYADGIVADERDKIIKKPSVLVGEDFESHYGEYNDDVIHIRNDELQCDFEISRDESTYDEAIGFEDSED